MQRIRNCKTKHGEAYSRYHIIIICIKNNQFHRIVLYIVLSYHMLNFYNLQCYRYCIYVLCAYLIFLYRFHCNLTTNYFNFVISFLTSTYPALPQPAHTLRNHPMASILFGGSVPLALRDCV